MAIDDPSCLIDADALDAALDAAGLSVAAAATQAGLAPSPEGSTYVYAALLSHLAAILGCLACRYRRCLSL